MIYYDINSKLDKDDKESISINNSNVNWNILYEKSDISTDDIVLVNEYKFDSNHMIYLVRYN